MDYPASGPELTWKWINRTQTPTDGIPQWILHPMDPRWVENLLGEPAGTYFTDPVDFTLRMHRRLGVSFLDQLVTIQPEIASDGWHVEVSSQPPVMDGIVIDSPEAVARHYEQFVIPGLEQAIRDFPRNAPEIRRRYVEGFRAMQERLGPEILYVPYGEVQHKPIFRYSIYGYVPYFQFYALYPTLQAEAFRLEADYAVLHNGLLGQAIIEEGFPPLVRVDHDMTGSQGTMADLRSLDAIYFPQLERALRPLIDRGIQLLWHCDGNVNDLIPRLLDMGFAGFQGFQYEYGVDYPAIARRTTRDGKPLILIVGASVTTTLVFGKPEDVHREIDWLVENSAEASIALGATSSICPGTPWPNIDALVESLRYYRQHGKAGLRQKVGRQRPFRDVRS